MRFYEDKILDGRWKYKQSLSTSMVEFVNIYNGMVIQLSERQIKQVLNGRDSIAHIMTRRIGKNPNNIQVFKYGNGVIKNWNKMKHINAVGGKL